jgi:hypothetical protein
VSVNADGERIASASLDGTVKVWKAPLTRKSGEMDAED